MQTRFRQGAKRAGIPFSKSKGALLFDATLWVLKKVGPMAAALALGWVLGARSYPATQTLLKGKESFEVYNVVPARVGAQAP